MSSLRVCVDARLVSGTSGGVEQVVIGLANGLSNLTDGDEEYLFLTYAGDSEWLRPHIQDPCRIVSGSAAPHHIAWKRWTKAIFPTFYNMWHRFSPLLGTRTVKVPSSDGTIERLRVDIMHFTFQFGFMTDIPTIYHPHDLQHIHLPQYFSPRTYLVREVTYRTLCKKAKMVAVTSSWVKHDIVQHYQLPESKVQVIPWAPVLPTYPTPSEDDVAAVKHRFSLPDTFLFYPAQTWRHKNHITLLEALAILRDRHGIIVPFVSCGLINDFYPKIQIRVRNLRLIDQVRFLGFVSPVELQCLYKVCKCVIIPSKFEAASFPLWEAFLAGTPAACSNVTSLPQQAGDAALVFDPEQPENIAAAIHRLWTNEVLCNTLVENGKKKVARFNWDRTARTFRAHYRRIAGRALTDEDRQLLASMPEI